MSSRGSRPAIAQAGIAHHKGSRTALEDTAIWVPPSAESPLTAFAVCGWAEAGWYAGALVVLIRVFLFGCEWGVCTQGVFDGHGGAAVAESAKGKLHAIAEELGVARCWKKSKKAGSGETPDAAEAKKLVVQAFERHGPEHFSFSFFFLVLLVVLVAVVLFAPFRSYAHCLPAPGNARAPASRAEFLFIRLLFFLRDASQSAKLRNGHKQV